VRHVPACLGLIVVALFAAMPLRAQPLPSVAPQTPWLSLADDKALTRIGVGSCLHQGHAQPIWRDVIAARPELFLMIGDNVYGDVKSAEMTELVAAYRAQGAHSELAAARAAFPFLATWDDHDYGRNDAGADFPYAKAAAALFLDFWQTKEEHAQGIYSARVVGPPGQRVQVILLDTRTFRSPLKRKTDSFPYWGRYEPDPAPDKTMLGAAQWAWLEAQLRVPAELRLLVSSVQVLAEGHGHERWGNLPAERGRLLELLDRSGAGGLVLLSGDRHSGALYRGATPKGRRLVEMTASSLNRSYGPPRDALIPPLVGRLHHVENFGLIEIDWAGQRLGLRLVGMGGEELTSLSVTFAEIGAGYR
jgi:alkaline phosphatase D